MNAERWQRISLFYHEARARTGKEQRAFLDSACGSDASLRQELESLLADEAAAEAFLAVPAGEALRLEMESKAKAIRGIEPGTMLGSYRIERLLGRGGMGAVFLAYDTMLRRRVALKVIDEPAGSATSRDRLVREARNAAALNHPNICTIYEVGEANGWAFIAMEYVDGCSLSDKLGNGALSVEDALRYGIQAADALAYAHDHGVVHGDFKAANAILTGDRLTIVDFGLARRSDAMVTSATTLSLVPAAGAGTPYAMAPEQVRGTAVDARTDIWALGVSLYEMVTAAKPFDAATISELFSCILRDQPKPVPARVPASLTGVILRCLVKEPAGRYRQAGEVRAALEALQPTLGRTQADVPERPGARAKASRGRIRALAVLPLVNLSPNPEEEYFADGMTDALITTLAQIAALRVISRTSVMQYKGARKPLPEIARELKVEGVIEGTVVRSGGRVRITAQLIRAATDTHLWARNYESDLRDVLSLQSEVARAIAQEIQIQLTPNERSRLTRKRRVNPAAYEAFLKGRHHWYRRSPDALKKALESLQHAIVIDPTYAMAHAGLADTYNILGWDLFGILPPGDAFPKGKDAARKALDLDPNCAEAHAAVGWAATAYDWDWLTAEAEFRRSIELKPQYGPVHIWYSHLLRVLGRNEESHSESRRAIECDPLGLVLNMHMGWHYLYSRQYPQAVDQLCKTLELDQSFILARMFLGEAYELCGRLDEAISEFEKAVSFSEHAPTYVGALGHAYAVSGQRDKALQIIEELREQANQKYVSARVVAEIYAGLGDTEQAFEWLDRATHQRNGWLIHLKENPRYDSLRNDPRYGALVRRMNLG